MEELLRNSACVPVGWWAILVRVRGYGRYVTGTYQGGVPGWRAERVVIDRLHVPPDVPAEIVAALAERYQCAVRIHHGWSAGLPCPGWDPAAHG
jgi:threonine dehydrogenase-like Zn-dependent dehydrogenase